MHGRGKKTRARILGLLLVAGALATAGCGSDLIEVGGTVTLDGQPLDRGTVVFQAQGLPQGVGQIAEEGSYTVTTGGERGLLPGTYQVTVSAYKTRPGRDEMDAPIPEFLTPPRYNNPNTSDLTADVSPDRRRFDFALQR